jgi:hypothetical protein
LRRLLAEAKTRQGLLRNWWWVTEVTITCVCLHNLF